MKNIIYRAKYKYADKLRLKKPVDVLMELSSMCNQKCVYCYHNSNDLPFTRGYMSFETAVKIIDCAAATGVHSLKFNWRGESTLNPYFSEILRYAKSKARGMTFIDRVSNSNFIFPKIKRDKILKALCCQTKVKVSFDTFDSEVFSKQRGNRSDWATAYQNIDDFYRIYNRESTELVIQAVKTKLNEHEDIESKLKKIWPDATLSIRDMVDGRVNNDNELSTKERDVSERKPCLQAFARIIFDHKGRAYPCCPDIESKLHLGDIHTMSIHEIWNSSRYRQLRNNLQTGLAFNNEPCKSCSSFESYKGYRHGWKS